jgi:acyl-CoA thioester hydrolase
MAEWGETGRGVVVPWICDQFGHMNVRWYANHFDDASFQVWSLIGVDIMSWKDKGVVAVVANTKIDFIKELQVGELFLMKSGFVRVGTKSVTYHQKMFNSYTKELHATNEITEVFFDPVARKAAPMPDEIRSVLEANLVDPDGQ